MSEWGGRRKFIERRGPRRRGPRSVAVRRITVPRYKHWQPPLEKKFADFEANSDAFASTWATMEDATIKSVSGVALGDTESQRDGRVYHISSIHMRCTVNRIAAEASANPASDLKGRICLIWDTQTNGAQMVATDAMDGGQTDDTLSFRNLQHSKRFKVLWDKYWYLRTDNMAQGAVDTFATGSQTTSIMRYNKTFKKPLKVICEGTTNAIDSLSDNSIHVIGIANSTSAVLNYQVRIRFV